GPEDPTTRSSTGRACRRCATTANALRTVGKSLKRFVTPPFATYRKIAVFSEMPSSRRASLFEPGRKTARSTPPRMHLQSTTAGASNDRRARCNIHSDSAETNNRQSASARRLRCQFKRVKSNGIAGGRSRSGQAPQPISHRSHPRACAQCPVNSQEQNKRTATGTVLLSAASARKSKKLGCKLWQSTRSGADPVKLSTWWE